MVAHMGVRVAVIENNIIATNTIRGALMKALVENKYEVVVLTTGMAKDLQMARATGLTVVDVGSSTQNPLDALRYMRNLKKALQSSKADICLTFTIRPAIWGNIVTRLLGVPTVTNITGIGPLFSRNNLPYIAARVLYRFVLKKTAWVFFQNTDDMGVFLAKRFANPERVERIPGSGVDAAHYAPRPMERTSKRFSFLFVSRLVKDKGILEYVEAARSLKGVVDADFNVLGPIWNLNLKDNTVSAEDLKSWQEEGIIKYLGETKDVRDFFAQTDCVVLPSYREGMSNVLLEAASMERPCVTTDTPGCRDIVEDGLTGYLCAVRDARDLAVQMKKLFELSPQERSEMGKKGRLKVIREYDKKTVINAYLRVIGSITQPYANR